jgi:excisionase family DNA binding protein
MSKKYLTIEEAALKIGITTSEVNRLREQRVLQGFADRGTWKFREEEVEKYIRSHQADSGADVPFASKGDESSVEVDAANVMLGDEDFSESQQTIISKSSEDSGSDSDVRLVFDESMKMEDSSASVSDDSDSDVKLAGSSVVGADSGSDSDVKLINDPSRAATATFVLYRAILRAT